MQASPGEQQGFAPDKWQLGVWIHALDALTLVLIVWYVVHCQLFTHAPTAEQHTCIADVCRHKVPLATSLHAALTVGWLCY